MSSSSVQTVGSDHFDVVERPPQGAEHDRVSLLAGAGTGPAERIFIPRIWLESNIIEVSLVQGEWPVPKYVVAHLAETSNPGDLGNAVFSGHLHSLSSGNVFARLHELQDGDEVIFSARGGQRLFRVVESRLVRNTDATVLANRLAKASVTLITCAGRWVPEDNDYDLRRVVVADLATV